MKIKAEEKGFVIALAWPETSCKQAGAWYEGIMRFFGYNRNGYYKVGHAAVILIHPVTGNCFYFDFGRYHAPFGYGRVRDEVTDHELQIKECAKIAEGKLLNFKAIVADIAMNESNHGVGVCYAAHSVINFKKAFQKAKEMQLKSPIRYGPFIFNGTNCSRFVRTIIQEGITDPWLRLKLSLPFSISPTPLGIIQTLGNYVAFQPNVSLSLNTAST